MKRQGIIIIISLFIIFALSNNVFSQNTYYKLYFGYGFSLGATNVEGFDNRTITADYSYYEQIDLSLGKGVNIGGAIGYMFNKNVGFELGASNLMSDVYSFKHTILYNNYYIKVSADMWKINPSLVYYTGSESINTYMKFGLIMYTGHVNYNYVYSYAGSVWDIQSEWIGDIGFGFNSALGVMVKLSNKSNIFTELEMVNFSFAPTKGTIIAAKLNGVDKFSSLSQSDKEITFDDHYTYDNNSSGQAAQPSSHLKVRIPFGGLNFNFGIRLRF